MLIKFKPPFTSIRHNWWNGVEIVLMPETVLMLPHHVPSGAGLPILSMRDLLTKFSTEPVSSKAEVSIVWLEARCSLTLETH